MEACQHLLAQVVFVVQRTPAPAYNAVAVSRDRAGLPCRGRFLRPRRFTTRRTTCPLAPAYNATVDSPVYTGLPRRGRFTHERLQLHLAIVNFMADYFRPGTSGDIHLKYILLVHIIFYQREVYLCLGMQ